MSGHSTYNPTSKFGKFMDDRLPLARLVHDSFVSFPVPRNLNSFYTFGGILMVMLVSQIITGVDDYQSMLINRNRRGMMLLGGETLYILEVHPAAYAVIAANEAEKASPIKLIHLQPYGAFGRLQLGGTEAHIREAVVAIDKALADVDGQPNEGRG